MNKPIKVILLLVFALMAVGAVLWFIETQVSPPDEVPESEQDALLAHVQTKAREYNTQSLDDLDSLYTLLKVEHDRLARFEADSAISADVALRNRISVDSAYTERVTLDIAKVFAGSTWSASDIKRVRNLINRVETLTLPDGTLPSVIANNERLSKQKSILSDYEAAMAISTSYQGEATDEAKFAKADELRNRGNLSNNAQIMNKLNNLRQAVMKSHYESIRLSIKSIPRPPQCYLMTSDKYDKLLESVENKINGYAKADYYNIKRQDKDNLWTLYTDQTRGVETKYFPDVKKKSTNDEQNDNYVRKL